MPVSPPGRSRPSRRAGPLALSIALLGWAAVSAPESLAAERKATPAQKEAELKQVRSRIERVRKSVNDDVEFIIEQMRQSGFEQAVVVDITRQDVGIPVVRAIVPRSEIWTLYFSGGGRASMGPRAMQQVR